MQTVHQEADRFFEFVKRSDSSQEAEPSLEECLRQWREEQELAETIGSIKLSIADIEVGRVMTIEEAGRRIRAKFGWPALDESGSRDVRSNSLRFAMSPKVS